MYLLKIGVLVCLVRTGYEGGCGELMGSPQEKLQQSLEELRSVLQKFHEQLDMARSALLLMVAADGCGVYQIGRAHV